MNQIRRCLALVGFALALTGWSMESAAWNKGAPHSETRVTVLADISQITTKFVEIVPPFHRQGSGIPFDAIR